MIETHLEVTFRKGKALAAYLYLPRKPQERSHRSVVAAPGLVVDYTRAGKPIGIELTSPGTVTLAAVNRVLRSIGAEPVRRADLRPLLAA
jgi:hypothetical protein